MWKNIVERSKLQTILSRMRIACRIPKTTIKHSGCIILIVFQLQQWLHERASILPYTYMVWLVSHLRSKKSAQFMEASIHTIHCHAAIEGKIACRLMTALVNKPEVQNIDAVLLI
jgi:hypothetical protein